MKPLPKNVEKHLYDLHLLKESKPYQQKALLEKSPDGLVRAIAQCCEQALKGEVPLNGQQYQHLKRHKQKVRKLARRGVSLKTKRKILTQKGGFGPLIPLLASVVGPLVGKLFG